MFNQKPAEKTALDEVIEEAYRELSGHDANSEDYAKIVEQLTALHAMKDTQKSDRVSKDTLALVLGNLAGIIVIVGHERAHIVTSKALNLIGKFK